MTSHEVKWGPCCFCALEITQTSIDPCRLTVETAGGKWQVWFCHAECFKEQLSTEPIYAACSLPPISSATNRSAVPVGYARSGNRGCSKR